MGFFIANDPVLFPLDSACLLYTSLLKEGKEFKVARQFQHSQARKAEINYEPDRTSFIEENTGSAIL